MNFPTSVTTFQVRSNFPTPVTTFQVHSNFPTPVRTFQLRSVRSNFAWFFPTSIGSFQLRLALSNFSETFQLQTFQLKTFQLLVLSNCPFQLHVSRFWKNKLDLYHKAIWYRYINGHIKIFLSLFPCDITVFHVIIQFFESQIMKLDNCYCKVTVLQ